MNLLDFFSCELIKVLNLMFLIRFFLNCFSWGLIGVVYSILIAFMKCESVYFG